LMAATESETCGPGPGGYGVGVKKSDLVLPYVMHIADFTEYTVRLMGLVGEMTALITEIKGE